MKVLVTGATGFIGSALCNVLKGAGHTVVGLSRNPQRAQRKVSALDKAYAWDLMREPAPREALEGVDAVVHLAGESVVGLWTPGKRKAIVETRVTGVRNLLQGISEMGERPKRLIGASAIGYYGDRGEAVLDESAPPGEGFLAETCVSWESETRRADALGVETTLLRIGVVLESGGGALGAMLKPFKLGVGGPLGSGEQWWSWIHRDDLIGLMTLCLEDTCAPSVINAVSPEPVRQKDFAKVLGGVLSRPAVLPAPAFAIRLLMGGFADELLFSKRVIPEAAQDAGYLFAFPDLELALREALD